MPTPSPTPRYRPGGLITPLAPLLVHIHPDECIVIGVGEGKPHCVRPTHRHPCGSDTAAPTPTRSAGTAGQFAHLPVQDEDSTPTHRP